METSRADLPSFYIDVQSVARVIRAAQCLPAWIPGCLHVPMNIDGKKQTERPTTTEEFFEKLQAAGTRDFNTLPCSM